MLCEPYYWIIGGILLAYSITAVILLGDKNVEIEPFGFVEVMLIPGSILLFVLLYQGWPKSVKGRLARFYDKRSIISGLMLILVTGVFHSIFLAFKMSFPKFVPFYADPLFSDMDRIIHFGKLPWEWLAPALANIPAIWTIDFLYTLWLLVDFFSLLWQGFAPKKADVRATFFLTYFTTWIVLGTIIALYYSSAGPCYFDRLYPALTNPYKEQMDFLHEVDSKYVLGAVLFQRELWENQSQGIHSFINGISAFPSLHVAVSLLLVLVARHYSRRILAIASAYFVIIMVGSVALGWHYAVDGYFAAVLTLLLWMMNAYFVRRFALWKPRGNATRLKKPVGEQRARKP